jgi:hypothetical protein
MDAMLQICEINDASQKNVAISLETKIGEIAGSATKKIVERAGPLVVDVIEQETKFQLQTVRRRTLFTGATGFLIGIALVAGVSYATGFVSGQAHGEVIANTISVAMESGPTAAAAWSTLMANNDPVQALAECQKTVAVASDGRHYCSMPVWLDRKVAPD